MRNRTNLQFWLNEQDLPPLGGNPNTGAMEPQQQMPQSSVQNPALPGNPTEDQAGAEEDITQDPAFPDMPEEQENDDFQVWKIKFVKESIKGDPNILVNKILSIRERTGISGYDRRFIEDNLDVNMLRQDRNILEPSTEIRKLIKKDFDRTYPATTLIRHITDTLQKNPLLNEIYVKFLGMGASKGDWHRKFVASMLGAVHVGSGGENPDLVFEEVDHSIRISTRFNARWGDINLGRWVLKEDDAQRFLKNVEMDKLEGGSPEEKDVLRRRVYIESIAEMFVERAFVINVVGDDGTVYHLGWDFGNSLKSAYLDGKLVVRTEDNDSREAFIDEEGSIIPIPAMNIYYIKESGEVDRRGKPEIEEIEFISYRNGTLYLSAQLDLIKEAAVSLQGIILRESLWQGNPTDLVKVMRCIPSPHEMLFRRC